MNLFSNLSEEDLTELFLEALEVIEMDEGEKVKSISLQSIGDYTATYKVDWTDGEDNYLSRMKVKMSSRGILTASLVCDQ